MANRRYAMLVGWRAAPDDGVSRSTRFDVSAPSTVEAIVAAARAASLSGEAVGEVTTVTVLSPAEERELGDLEGSGSFS